MQVGAVSLNNQSFGMTREDILNRIAELDENQIRQLAKEQTLYEVDSKKHRRLNRALTLSVPVAGGIAVAATMKKATRLGRVAGFANGFGSWAVPLLVGYGVVKGADVVSRNSQTAHNFERKHPILANIGLITAAYAGLRGVEKLINSISNKYGLKLFDKYSAQILKFSDKLDSSTILNNASKALKKAHPAVKEAGKTVLKAAPWALLLTGFIHWFKYNATKANQYVNNYHQIKNAQAEVQGYLAAQAEKTEEV